MVFLYGIFCSARIGRLDGEEESGDAEQDVEMEGPEADMIWSMRGLYHGLVPQELVKGWRWIFGVSTWIT